MCVHARAHVQVMAERGRTSPCRAILAQSASLPRELLIWCAPRAAPVASAASAQSQGWTHPPQTPYHRTPPPSFLPTPLFPTPFFPSPFSHSFIPTPFFPTPFLPTPDLQRARQRARRRRPPPPKRTTLSSTPGGRGRAAPSTRRASSGGTGWSCSDGVVVGGWVGATVCG